MYNRENKESEKDNKNLTNLPLYSTLIYKYLEIQNDIV